VSGAYLNDEDKKSAGSSLLYAPPNIMTKFTFGYSDTMADTLWVRLIQDFDLCEQKFSTDPKASHIGPGHIANCNKGWAYHMLDAITELAPHWRQPALVGPLFLSILIDDIQGASALFRKVLKVFNKDWAILFRAGYHFLYEEQDFVYAAQLYDQAGRYGAPGWVSALAGKLYSQSGRNMIARTILYDALKRTPKGKIYDRILARLKKVEEEIQSKKNTPETYSPNSIKKAVENMQRKDGE
jgi:tetratricopeptide (TPR) repeat protein